MFVFPADGRLGRFQRRKLVGLALVSEDESTKGHFRTVWLDARLLLKIGAVAVVVGWFAAAGGLRLWLGRNPYNRVGFADLACPWRWKQMGRTTLGLLVLDVS